MEVEVVRTKITLACTECKNRNYNTTKDKKAHPDRMETKKYCRFCKSSGKWSAHEPAGETVELVYRSQG